MRGEMRGQTGRTPVSFTPLSRKNLVNVPSVPAFSNPDDTPATNLDRTMHFLLKDFTNFLMGTLLRKRRSLEAYSPTSGGSNWRDKEAQAPLPKQSHRTD